MMAAMRIASEQPVRATGWKGGIPVDRMVLCVKCSYGLLGLRSDQHCPECDTPVSQSLWSQPALANTDADTLRHIGIGMALVAGTLLATIVLCVVRAVTGYFEGTFVLLMLTAALSVCGSIIYLTRFTAMIPIEEVRDTAEAVNGVARFAVLPLVTPLLLPAALILLAWHMHQVAQLTHEGRLPSRFAHACQAFLVVLLLWPVAFLGVMIGQAWLLAVAAAFGVVAFWWFVMLRAVRFSRRQVLLSESARMLAPIR